MHFLLVLFAIATCFVVSFSMSSVAFGLFGYTLGVFLCAILYKGDLRNKAIRIFSWVFTAYVLFTVFRYIDIATHMTIFNKGFDETTFWRISNEAIGKSFSEIINQDLLQRDVFLKEPLYWVYLHTLANIAENFFDGNHILLQLLGTSVIGAQISIFIVGLVNKYSNKHLEKKVLSFMFLTCVLIESLIIHRDVLMMMIYVLVIYISLCRKWSIFGFVVQLLMALAAFYIREANGLFLLTLVFVNCYLHAGKASKVLLTIMVIGFAAALITLVTYFYDTLITLSDSYAEWDELHDESSGIAVMFDQLPSPLRELARTFQGQLYPLPLWIDIVNAKTFYGIIIGFVSMVVAVYWFRLMAVSVRFSFVKIKEYDIKLFVFWCACLLYILLNCMNADPRRMMAMYPIAYVIFLRAKDIIPRRSVKQFDKLVYGFVILLSIVYVVAKGGLS